ncbi:MAG: hypothetical protein M1484_01960 [Patescibacteria group bacterium]|nr:hypothetical protein [Patescibacteria group bacterium]MCL5431846.1 hypothetical protein [Patescibacteria group bacterium]
MTEAADIVSRTPDEIRTRMKAIEKEISDRDGLHGQGFNQILLLARLHELEWLTGEDKKVDELLRQ